MNLSNGVCQIILFKNVPKGTLEKICSRSLVWLPELPEEKRLFLTAESFSLMHTFKNKLNFDLTPRRLREVYVSKYTCFQLKLQPFWLLDV